MHTGTKCNVARDDDLVQDVLWRLAELDKGQRKEVPGGVYSLAALAVPDWAQAITRPQTTRRALSAGKSEGAADQLQTSHVTSAELMIGLFADADTAFGGGHSRLTLASYLARHIAPLLNVSGASRMRTRMLSVAAKLTYLCGFMCFDDEQHASAQRYYRTALDLATEAGDPDAYAVTLRALSVQARILGHYRHAVQLAKTAAATAGRAAPIRQAFLLGQVAAAAAAAGDRRNALSALTAAEAHLDRAGSRPSSDANALMGDYHPAALANQQATVRALLGDRKGAITSLTTSLRHRAPAERRSRAITTAHLAELYLAQGHLDRAITTWHAFLDDYPHLTSGRANRALTTLRQRIRPHAAQPAARHLVARATTLRGTRRSAPETGRDLL